MSHYEDTVVKKLACTLARESGRYPLESVNLERNGYSVPIWVLYYREAEAVLRTQAALVEANKRKPIRSDR